MCIRHAWPSKPCCGTTCCTTRPSGLQQGQQGYILSPAGLQLPKGYITLGRWSTRLHPIIGRATWSAKVTPCHWEGLHFQWRERSHLVIGRLCSTRSHTVIDRAMVRPKKKTPEIPITEPKKLGSVGREKFFFWKFFY